MDLVIMIALIILVGYGAYRYSKWVKRDKPHPGGGGSPVDDDLPTYDDNPQK